MLKSLPLTPQLAKRVEETQDTPYLLLKMELQLVGIIIKLEDCCARQTSKYCREARTLLYSIQVVSLAMVDKLVHN